MTFEKWFERERKAELLCGADEEVAKAAWVAAHQPIVSVLQQIATLIDDDLPSHVVRNVAAKALREIEALTAASEVQSTS